MDTIKLIEIIAKAAKPSLFPAWVQAASAVVLVIVTVLYVWYTNRMVQAMKGQVEEMKKQNEADNKYKSIDLWDRALNEFFIPFKDGLAKCSIIIMENEQPSIQALYKELSVLKQLFRYWSYRVFDEDKAGNLRKNLIAIEEYFNRNGLTGAEKLIVLNNIQQLIDLFQNDIKDIKKRLKFETLN